MLVSTLSPAGDLFVPEVLIAARAMHAGMDTLRPLLADADVASAGRVVVGTAAGDLHDTGKNLVGMMLEGGGFDIVDLGTDISPDQFIETVKAEQPDIIGLSALLTTAMPAMKQTIKALAEASLPESVNAMIGGAPVTGTLSEEIGADGCAPDAASAVGLQAPLLILAGESDANYVAMPSIHAQPIHAAVPDSELVIIEGAGHFLFAEDPDGMAHVVTRFLSSQGLLPAECDQALLERAARQ